MKIKTLKKNYEFKNVLTKGKKYRGSYIDIFIKRNNSNINQIGIAVSTKTANSVNRNRIKRLIRENYRLIEDKLEKGNCLVILWKKDKDIEDANFTNIKEDMYMIFQNAKLIKE